MLITWGKEHAVVVWHGAGTSAERFYEALIATVAIYNYNNNYYSNKNKETDRVTEELWLDEEEEKEGLIGGDRGRTGK